MQSRSLFQSARRSQGREVVGLAPLLFFWLVGAALLGSYLGPPEFDRTIRGVVAQGPAHAPLIARQ